MEKKITLTALIFGLLSVVLGAFGAHALKKALSLESLNTFEVGVRYLMYHAFLLFFIAQTQYISKRAKNTVYYCIVVGILFFSGSIFLLATQKITGINFKFLGPITPLGGVLLITGWVVPVYNILTKKI